MECLAIVLPISDDLIRDVNYCIVDDLVARAASEQARKAVRLRRAELLEEESA